LSAFEQMQLELQVCILYLCREITFSPISLQSFITK
jgi:hypothetical protein